MLGRSFNSLLSGRRLGTALRWRKAHRCPCASTEGEADPKCGVCLGTGRYYDDWSQEFRAGFTGQDAKTLIRVLKQMGGGADIGDAVITIPLNAPCYASVGSWDRFQVVGTTDELEWLITPGSRVRLPESCIPVSATVRSVDKQSVVDTAFPTPGADGRISVAVPTTIKFEAARMYEVAPPELSKVRSFGVDGQPKKVILVRVDWTVR